MLYCLRHLGLLGNPSLCEHTLLRSSLNVDNMPRSNKVLNLCEQVCHKDRVASLRTSDSKQG